MPAQREVDEAEIRQLVDKIVEGLQGKDLEGLKRLYATDIVSFDGEPPLQHVGIEAKLENWAPVFISSPAAFAELLMRGGVPVVEGLPDGVFDPELFARISAELGDQVLGPPGTEPRNAEVPGERAEGGHR